MSEQLEAALTYARQGWQVFPLHSTDSAGRCTCGKSGCSRGKHPRTENGFKDATTDEPTIKAWWGRWPTANIGIATGASGLFVVDVDVNHTDGVDGYEAWQEIRDACGTDVDETMIVDTPSGGQHIYYRTNGHRLANTAGKLGAGLDTRGEGGYVVAPGSVIGKIPYSFAEGHGLLCLAPLPDRLAALLTKPAGNSGQEPAAPTGASIPEGQRHTDLQRMGAKMGRWGFDADAIEAALLTVPCDPPHDAGDIHRMAIDAAKWGAQHREKPGAKFNLTELGNAERFAARCRQRLAAVRGQGLRGYDARRGTFTTEHAILHRYAKETVRAIYAEAAACPDDAKRKALADHARRSETRRALDAMLALAESEEALEAETADFDADPDLLNVRNGVVNLRTGELSEHSPDYRMTKVAGAAYDPSSTCPTWLAHLDRIFEGDAAMVGFLQRAYGYALTGRSSEQVFMVWHGGGQNGKGVTVNACCEAAGEYAATAQVSTFSPHRTDAIRNDLAALAGARLVTTSEGAHRQTLDTAIVKQLTGNDPITARFLHREFFTFVPQFLIVMSTNHRPHIECPDFAIKRRVLLVPFTVTIPEAERDQDLGGKLRAELSGVLTWGVQGAIDYLTHGLCAPDKVQAATEAYREEMDPLFGFAEYCTFDPGAWTATADIRRAVERWAKDEGVRVLPTSNELGDFLRRLGCEPGRLHGGRGWRGVRCEGVESAESFSEA